MMPGVIRRVSAIVLAAGASRRMGRNKLLLDFNGKPVLSHTLDLIESLAFKEKIIVSASITSDNISLPLGVKLILNHSPEKGMGESLRLGVNEACGDYYMFFLGDMPFVSSHIATALIAEIEGGKIIIPQAGKSPSNPVIFPKLYRDELLAVRGDSGGRQVIAAHTDQCKMVRIDAAALSDIDTPEDYLRITTRRI